MCDTTEEEWLRRAIRLSPRVVPPRWCLGNPPRASENHPDHRQRAMPATNAGITHGGGLPCSPLSLRVVSPRWCCGDNGGTQGFIGTRFCESRRAGELTAEAARSTRRSLRGVRETRGGVRGLDVRGPGNSDPRVRGTLAG
jgi:hypothetical protein